MRLPAFAYLQPKTVGEAVELLAAHSGARLVAGGTDVLPNMKRRQESPPTLVGLSGIAELRRIEIDEDDALIIGSLTPLRALATAPGLPRALTLAAGQVGSPQIRNVATVGGNLCLDTRCAYLNQNETWRVACGLCLKAGGDVCWVAPKGGQCVAVSSSDLAPVMVALDGEIELEGPDGSRRLPAGDFFCEDGIEHLAVTRHEIVTAVRIPAPSRWRTTYRKLRRRRSIDFPILGVAAAVRVSDDGMVEDARIVVGAAAPAPIRIREAEERVVGAPLTSDVIQEASDLAARRVRPYDNVDAGSRYRKWMAPVFVARALQDVS